MPDKTSAMIAAAASPTLPQLIESTAARIARAYAGSDAPLSVSDLLEFTGEFEQSVIGRRRRSRSMASQILLWFEQLPRATAANLTASALAEHTRTLLYLR